MTDEQINAAIRAALGNPKGCPRCDSGECAYNKGLNYCNDLNSMHEAEKMLTEHQNESIYPRNLGAWRNPTKPIYATARQRAEAFLRTLGIWEEATVNDSLTVREEAE